MTKKTLKLACVLFEYIEPLVILYTTGKTFYVASAMPSDVGYVEKYLVVSVSSKVFKRYCREEVDLRYLFVSAKNRSFWEMQADEIDKETVQVSSYNGHIAEDLLPAPQFFASSQTGHYDKINNKVGNDETIYINGNWEMEDFGSFSRKLRDIYSFEDAIEKISDPNTGADRKKRISEVLMRPSLHSGGNYLSFFSDLKSVIPANDRFQLNRIKYASPGEIALKGNSDIFDAIENYVKNIVGNEHELYEMYNSLYNYMSSKNFLDVSNHVPEPKADEVDFLEAHAAHLLQVMGFKCFNTIKSLNINNSVNIAKIALALCRRIKEVVAYFAEGRASYER
ncbi:MAG: hypothetical protein ABF628_04455 [Acetobacter orientalis]|uniref:hypothetical protein n=1 Tax=Acetobacter orientalis TaxID=146474 RepID=UPI0039E84868